ncbi:hypothetical protein M1506_00685 [Patescibacteria group bacterium]|nr:hypothetical protein [Patescibacteria group bacterium]
MKKIKEILSVDTRISIFQTAMNNAGRNFEGKDISVEKMAKFAVDFYQIAISEIKKIGELEIEKLKQISEVESKGYAAKLKATKNLKQLKAVWSGLPVEAKKELTTLKNQLKKKYENPKIRK